MLCTTNLMTTYKNLSLFFSLGTRLEEKNKSQKLCATNLLTIRKNDERGSAYYLYYKFLELTIYSFFF